MAARSPKLPMMRFATKEAIAAKLTLPPRGATLRVTFIDDQAPRGSFPEADVVALLIKERDVERIPDELVGLTNKNRILWLNSSWKPDRPVRIPRLGHDKKMQHVTNSSFPCLKLWVKRYQATLQRGPGGRQA